MPFAVAVIAIALNVIAGIAPARADEGQELFDRGLYDEAIAWWKKASSERGDAQAAFRLGDIYEAGAVVEENFPEAAKWYALAAEAGHPAAQFALAAFYEAGAGVAQSSDQAAHWYRECAGRNQPDCQFSLGVLLSGKQEGIGDPVEAYKWLYLAAKNGLIEFDAPELVDLAATMGPEQKRDALKRAVAFSPVEWSGGTSTDIASD